MNRTIFFGAVLIAMIAASAACGSSVVAASNIQNSQAPQQSNRAPALTIAPSLDYEINGSLHAWVNLTGYALITTNLADYETINVTVRELYLDIRVWLTCTKITVNSTTGVGTANVTVGSRIIGRVNIYFGVGQNTKSISNSVDKSEETKFPASWFVPWGTTNNFSLPMPSFSTDQIENSTADPEPVPIAIIKDNVTSDSIVSSTVRHVQFKFDDWLMRRVNNTINDLWGKSFNATGGNPQSELMKLIPSPYPVTTIGRIDLWKGNATTSDGKQADNILLMAGEIVNLLIKSDWVDNFGLDASYKGTPYHATININLHAELGVLFTLSVTTDYFRHQLWGNAEIATFTINIPEKATPVWRKIGVIVYYGSPAHGCDITGGLAQGSASTGGGGTLFFVDYGWDGTPDFAANGTYGALTTYLPISHPTATVTGTTFPFTVQLDKSAGGWIYFSCRLPSGTLESDITVKRNDGKTVDPTQYWLQDKYLYVCDDPTYTYTVELVSGGGLGAGFTTMMIIGGAIAVVVIAAAVVVLRRRGAKPTNVSIK